MLPCTSGVYIGCMVHKSLNHYNKYKFCKIHIRYNEINGLYTIHHLCMLEFFLQELCNVRHTIEGEVYGGGMP
jgi:hypothetical protein